MPPTLRSALTAKAAFLIAALAVTGVAGARVVSTRTPPGDPAPAGFTVAGRVVGALHPGRTATVNLRLTNPHRWDLLVSGLTVAMTVDPAHERAGCRRAWHYRLDGVSVGELPVRLPARSTRTLRQVGILFPPRIIMLSLPRNQDVCKGARLRLRYRGRASRYGRPLAR